MRFTPHLFKKATLPILISCFAGYTLPSHAEVNVKAAPNVDISLRARVQPVYYYADSPVISERDTHDFRMRRARIALKATMDERFTAFIQTGYSEAPGSSGSDMKIIDAYASIKATDNLTLYTGQFLAPALRQNITSAGGLLTFDRPGVIYKSLSWGTRALGKFSSMTMKNTDAGLRGNVDVRDLGVLVKGADSLSESMHYKYYAGAFEGARSAQSERLVVRGQVNFGEAESGYFSNATYFGKKETVALGFSYDTQAKVAVNSENDQSVDYSLYSADIFVEKKLGGLPLNVEAALINLDLGDAEQLLDPVSRNTLNGISAKQSQGQGYYIQSALTFGKWQPWLGYESWASDADNNAGSYAGTRLGMTYLINGHKANVKLGIENIEADQAFTTAHGETDSLTTFSTGLFFSF